MLPAPMPDRYIAEMFVDRVAACKVYNGSAYTDSSPWEYYLLGRENAPLHPHTKDVLERLLCMLREKGEKETYRYIRTNLLDVHKMK